MTSVVFEPTKLCHVVAVPHPGRGHINSLMNFCKILVSKSDNLLITFAVTEEWLGFIGSEPKPEQIRFCSIPNVLPSELVRAADVDGFFEAVATKLEAPFELLLDRLETPATLIMADTILFWAVAVGNRRNIPVASFWPMSASVFSVIRHRDPVPPIEHSAADSADRGDEGVDKVPVTNEGSMVRRMLEAFTWVSKAQYLLLTTVEELESETINSLKSVFSYPVYAIGPAIPYLELRDTHTSPSHDGPDYMEWLDQQPSDSVLYVSMGSFLSVSSDQMNQIAAGLCQSGVKFLWVARGDTRRLNEACGDKGLVVPWCDQLKVLRHCSVGGFWSHCGWNSVREGAFAGVPFLTFPIIADQRYNSKMIMENWKVGWSVKEFVEDGLVSGEEISGLVKKFMDLESKEGKELRRKAKEIQEVFRRAIEKGGSSEINISSFIKDISQRRDH